MAFRRSWWSSDARTFRLLRVGKSGDTWFIWYELGGLGVSMHEVFYGLGVSGMTHEPEAFRWGGFVSWKPCLATDAFLDGVWPENAAAASGRRRRGRAARPRAAARRDRG